MKRLFFTVALAALALGTAQAVNVNWDYSSSTNITTGYYTMRNATYGGDTSFAVSVTLQTGSSISAGTALLGFSNGADSLNSGRNYIKVTNDNGVFTIANVDQNYGTASAASSMKVEANSTYHISLVVERGANAYPTAGANPPDVYTLFVNGVQVAQLTETDCNIGGSINRVHFGSDVGTFSNGLVYSAEADEDLMDIAQTYSIPEPTALALLALGVAGVALRRRVA